MNKELFFMLLGLVLVNAPLAFFIANRRAIVARIAAEPRAMVPVVSVVGVLFGLFTSFTAADVGQRATSLQLASDRELSAARSLINLSTGIGPSAAPIRYAVTEYLQTVASVERKWLQSGGRENPPGDATVSSLSLVTTVFAEQGKANAVLKSLIMSRVEELIAARTERITRTLRQSERTLWVSLVLMAIVTQYIGAFALSGSRMQSAIFLAGYTFVAAVALTELAWADRLIGPSRIAEQAALFEQLLAQSQ